MAQWWAAGRAWADRGQVGIGGEGVADRGLGAIHLVMQLDWDEHGEFLAHFTRQQPPSPPQPGMDIDLLYANAMALQAQVWPCIELVFAALALLKWENPHRSRVALATWLVCCYWPWVTPLVLHLLLLRHLWAKHALIKPAGAEQGELVSPRSQKENEVRARRRLWLSGSQEKHAATLGWVGSMANSSKLMMPAETKSWLAGIQNTLGSTAATLDGVYGMFDWRDYGTTKSITLGVLASLFLHATVLSFGYTWGLVGLAMFSLFTWVFLDGMNAIGGLSSYYIGKSFYRLAAQAKKEQERRPTRASPAWFKPKKQ